MLRQHRQRVCLRHFALWPHTHTACWLACRPLPGALASHAPSNPHPAGGHCRLRLQTGRRPVATRTRDTPTTHRRRAMCPGGRWRRRCSRWGGALGRRVGGGGGQRTAYQAWPGQSPQSLLLCRAVRCAPLLLSRWIFWRDLPNPIPVQPRARHTHTHTAQPGGTWPARHHQASPTPPAAGRTGTTLPCLQPARAPTPTCLQALTIGAYAAAVDHCLAAHRYADALLIANTAGRDLYQRTMRKYMQRCPHPYQVYIQGSCSPPPLNGVRQRHSVGREGLSPPPPGLCRPPQPTANASPPASPS